jgi:hypothetical protein
MSPSRSRRPPARFRGGPLDEEAELRRVRDLAPVMLLHQVVGVAVGSMTA